MIELKGVTAGYTRQPVLRDFSLTLTDGGITVLIGPNGCGKSTLLKLAAGLLRPQSGSVKIDGRPITEYSAKELAQRIAYLPQARPLPAITAEAMVLHGRFPYLSYPRRYRPQDREAARQAMEAVGAQDLAEREVTTLSGGERQKVYIAMALAQQTPTVLLDEPTTYLDIDRQLEVMRLCSLLREQGKTVVMVLHDLNLAFRFADTLHLLCAGGLAASGSPEDIAASGELERIFHISAHRVTLPGLPVQYLFG